MKYYVDFSGYLTIEADSSDDAERKMWALINSLNMTGDYSDDVWDIENIEPIFSSAQEILESGAHIISQGDSEVIAMPPEGV